MTGRAKKSRYRRGFPVAILVGFEESCAVVWQVYSGVAKALATVALSGTRRDDRAVYSFHEEVVDALRPALKEGVRSIVVASPVRTSFATDFLAHVQRHHAWLTRARGLGQATFGELVGSAIKPQDVAQLARTPAFRRIIGETTSEEADYAIETLEKSLGDASGAPVLYSLEEAEDLIYGRWKDSNVKPVYLMFTDAYLAERTRRGRLDRLLQISKNKGVRTRVVGGETPAGKRLSQMGGLVCLTQLGPATRPRHTQQNPSRT